MKPIIRCRADQRHVAIRGCVVGCFDPRFRNPLNVYCLHAFETSLNSNELDIVLVDGGAAKGADSESLELRDDILRLALLSVKLHRTPRVDFTDHEDCGALDGSRRFGSRPTEIAWHRHFLKSRARMFTEISSDTLADWRANGINVGGKFLAPTEVRNLYPDSIEVRTVFFGFDGAWRL